MTKQIFLENLKAALLEINDHDVDERISFYSDGIIFSQASVMLGGTYREHIQKLKPLEYRI